MSFHKFHNRIPIGWLIAATLLVLVAILTIGLKPKALSHSNNADWLADRPGIRFEKNGIAYTDSIVDLIQEHISPQRGFSIEVALKPKSFQDEGFCFILLIHDGNDRGQLLIGQYRSWIIAMNGDDYDNRRKTKRISFNSASAIPDMHLLTVTTDSEGSKIYIDGRLVKSGKELHLEIPDGKTARLVLGNSVYGNHPWRGEIYGVALYGKALSRKEAEAHFQAFSKDRQFSFTKRRTSPFLLYPLDEHGGALAKDDPGGTYPLHLPSKMKTLSPRLFPGIRLGRLFDRSIFTNRDAFLNLIGFIPLGVLLSATLVRLGGGSERHAIAIALVTGFFISLLIETVQAWMPDRTSDIQDLVLNTMGTLIGAVICKYFIRVQSE